MNFVISLYHYPFQRQSNLLGIVPTALCRVYWGPPCFQGDFMHNEKRLPALGASLVYNFLLVVTIIPKNVSGC